MDFRKRFSELMVKRATFDAGRLPGRNDRVPVIRVNPRRIRVLASNFYVDGRVPQVGEVIEVAGDDARDLVARRLAGFV